MLCSPVREPIPREQISETALLALADNVKRTSDRRSLQQRQSSEVHHIHVHAATQKNVKVRMSEDHMSTEFLVTGVCVYVWRTNTHLLHTLPSMMAYL